MHRLTPTDSFNLSKWPIKSRLHRRSGFVRAAHPGTHLGPQGLHTGRAIPLQLKQFSSIACLTRSNFLIRLYDGAVKSAQIVEFLQAQRTQPKSKLLIVWDGAAQLRRRIARE